MTRRVIGRHREAEANRITALLALPCALALVGDIWPVAGTVIGWFVAALFGIGVAAGVLLAIVRRSASRRRADREMARWPG